MTNFSQNEFLRTLPEQVIPRLPAALQGIKVRQPWRWLVQMHYGEPRLHYEVSPVRGGRGWELGFHCEANDKQLNRYLLIGFRRHLFEIKDTLGPGVEAEMWDRGWTKIYEVAPPEALTAAYQAALGQRLAAFIVCLHPIYVALREDVARVYR
ncbi:MAG: hypothetical protein KC425_15045 [Anaerolineales bacterium]|nr:hypothetical protein [Anaerolineales bacterium]